MLRSLLVFSTLAFAVFAGLACTSGSLAYDSAPELGCEPEAITVDEKNVPLQGPSSWRATCAGKRWFCSRADRRVICTEDPR